MQLAAKRTRGQLGVEDPQVDAAARELVYLGSANWTGAGLGAKGSGRRNFEIGIVTDDAPLLDQLQAMYDRVWSGRECGACKLRDVCPGPLDGDGVHSVNRTTKPRPKKSKR